MKISIGFSRLDKIRLPIFYRRKGENVTYYAPGYVVLVDVSIAKEFEDCLIRGNDHRWEEAIQLRRYAIRARQEWERLIRGEFIPTCLTLYLNEQCHMGCIYCFALPPQSTNISSSTIDINAVVAAARKVAGYCRLVGQPLTAVFHGGGEPALHLSHIQQLLTAIEDVAIEYRLPLFRYIATGAAVPEKNMRWVAEHFDLIGLSCDGPPEIQTLQRPLRNGRNSSFLVERAARIVHEHRKPLHIRVTITAASAARQPEIAEYVCRNLHPQEIHVEPVYSGLRGNESMSIRASQVDVFLDRFLEAQRVAQTFGIAWKTSGSRWNEIHGPYCNILKNVLHLVPENGATACFKITNAVSALQKGLLIGYYDPCSQQYHINTPLLQQQQERLQQALDKCAHCFNQYHCTRSCPDFCLLQQSEASGSVRCLIQGGLMVRKIYQTEMHLHTVFPNTNGVVGGKILP